jgi:predicted nucleotidyltransferase
MIPLKPNDPNVLMLERVARHFGEDLCKRMVFVGGAAAGLLITDLAVPSIRRTDDVDVVTNAKALDDYHRLGAHLRTLGFVDDLRPEAPICRWIVDGITVDVMPTKEEILGFTNRWYVMSVATAQTHELPSGIKIKVIRAPEFLATKLEAFYGRGKSDFLFSHDMGDIVSVIDGRDSLVSECQNSERSLREYLALQFQGLLKITAFVDSLPGHLPPDPASQERLFQLIEKIHSISEITAA